MACRGNAPTDVSISSHESSPDRGGVAANDLNRNANGMKRLVLSCWFSVVMTLVARHNKGKSQLWGQKRSPWSRSTHHAAISTEPLQLPRSSPRQGLAKNGTDSPDQGSFSGWLARSGRVAVYHKRRPCVDPTARFGTPKSTAIGQSCMRVRSLVSRSPVGEGVPYPPASSKSRLPTVSGVARCPSTHPQRSVGEL